MSIVAAPLLVANLRSALNGVDVAKFGAVHPSLATAADGTATIHLAIDRRVDCGEVRDTAKSVQQKVPDVSMRVLLSSLDHHLVGDRHQHSLQRQADRRLNAMIVTSTLTICSHQSATSIVVVECRSSALIFFQLQNKQALHVCVDCS